MLLLPWPEVEEQQTGKGTAHGDTGRCLMRGGLEKRSGQHPGICAAGGTSDAAMAHNRFGGVAPGVLEVQLVGWHREPSWVSLCCVVAASRLKSGDSPLGHAQRVLLGNIEICDIL